MRHLFDAISEGKLSEGRSYFLPKVITMEVKTLFGVVLVLFFLATVQGQSLQQCQDTFTRAASQVTNPNEICDLVKVYLACVFKDTTLTPELRTQLTSLINQMLAAYNLQCAESINELVREAEESTGKTTSGVPLNWGENITPEVFDEHSASDELTSQRCTDAYLEGLKGITHRNDICDLAKEYLTCIFKEKTFTTEQRTELKRRIEQSFLEGNIECSQSVEELMGQAEAGGSNGSTKTSGAFTALAAITVAVITLMKTLTG